VHLTFELFDELPEEAVGSWDPLVLVAANVLRRACAMKLEMGNVLEVVEFS